jgi:hypothetical protein
MGKLVDLNNYSAPVPIRAAYQLPPDPRDNEVLFQEAIKGE